jgi:PAS domain S-box-containing protein
MDDPDDAVNGRFPDESALARAIKSNLYLFPDDARCKKNLKNGHVIERYLSRTPSERARSSRLRYKERHSPAPRRHHPDEIPVRSSPQVPGEKTTSGSRYPPDADLLWLDDPQTLCLKKKLHIHDSATFAGNLAHFFSSACVRDAMKKVRLLSELRASVDRAKFPVFGIDCGGKVIAWNGAMEDLTGFSAREMTGRGVSACAVALYGYDRPMLLENLIRPAARQSGQRTGHGSGDIITGKEETVWLQEGSRHIRCRARNIHDDGGAVVGAIQSVGIIERPAGSLSFSERIMGTSSGISAADVVPSPPSDRPARTRPGADTPVADPATGKTTGSPEQGTLVEGSGRTSPDWEENLHHLLRNLVNGDDGAAADTGDFFEESPAVPARVPGQEDPGDLTRRVVLDAREGIIVFDTSLRCILWNPFMEHLTGLRAREVTGKHAFDMFPDLRDADAELLLRNALSGTTVESSDISLRIPMTGKQAWIRLIFSSLHDNSGTTAGIIAIVQDVTARKVMEYALESTIVQLMESEEKYRLVFNAKNDPLLLVDTGTQQILDLNEAAAELYGYSRAEFPGIRLSQLFTSPEPCSQLMVPQDRGIQMYHQRRKDGTIFPADISYARFELRGRELLLLSIRDTTTLHETSDALRLANTKLNLLIGVTRHDIINNLTVVMGYNDLLRHTLRDDHALAMLEKENSALQIIHRQIEFTRQYYNLGVKSPVWQNVCEISTQAYSQLVTTIVFSCDTRDLEIYADPLLEKVFYNLFDNAVRHGESVLRIRMYCIPDGTELVLVFGDDGIGVSAENKERIFRRGFGSHTGLGLFLMREILAITRIGISETGEYEKGARFELRIPAGNFRFPDSGVPQKVPASGRTDLVT